MYLVPTELNVDMIWTSFIFLLLHTILVMIIQDMWLATVLFTMGTNDFHQVSPVHMTL